MDPSPNTSILYQQAIDAALDSKWEEALIINKKIIKLDPKNVDALNRQAKAYMELGKSNLAKKYYSEVLKIDPYNPIAQKNLKIMKSFKPNGQAVISCASRRLSPSLFLQEPGKTKIVNLLKVAEPQKLSHVFCGMKVEMIVKNRKITIADSNGNYLGVLPDDISHHLSRLSKGGNKYELFVKSVRVNSLSIMIKEIYRSKKFKNQPSFLEYSKDHGTTNILSSFEGSGSDEETDESDEEPES
ncbi:tetratricopeptide repeat protein [Candidatus Daviesbacteria bacterium]|nr:tetratricopeptide repeat protein [Candidatus Daviesbacteria bacterium]